MFAEYLLHPTLKLSQSSIQTAQSVLSNLCWIIIVLCTWLGWRIWRFTLYPKLHPKAPKQKPYWIPFVGHAIEFLLDNDATFSRSIAYFQSSQRPFALTLLGRRLYVVTSLADILKVYKNTTSLPFDDIARNFIISMGASEEGARIFYDVPYENGNHTGKIHKILAHAGTDYLKQQLLPGTYFEELCCTIQNLTIASLEWETMTEQSSATNTGSQTRLLLSSWCHKSFFTASATALFGPHLLEAVPHLQQLYNRFDEESWKLDYKVPPILSKKLHASRAGILSAFERYILFSKEEKNGASWMAHVLEDEMRTANMPAKDVAAFFGIILFATTANTHKVCFWMLCHIIFDAELYRAIRDEVERSFQSSDAFLEKDVHLSLEKCGKLSSVYNECLRFYTSSLTVRSVKLSTDMGDVTFDAGAHLIIPYRQLHFSENNFGGDTDTFHADRFYLHEELGKSQFFRPFGGGTTQCSGQHLARRHILFFVALATHRYNFQLADCCLVDGRASVPVKGFGETKCPKVHGHMKNTKFPRCNTKKLRSGVLPPMKDEDVELILRKRIIES